jgi:hypothetical protein
MCSVKDVYKLPYHILRFSYLTILLKFKSKAEYPRPEAEETIVAVSK